MTLSSLSLVLLLFGVVLAIAAFPTAAVVSGALGVAWEFYLFYKSGT
jgi:hypothetical protein